MAIEITDGTTDIVLTYKNRAGTVTRKDWYPMGLTEIIANIGRNELVFNRGIDHVGEKGRASLVVKYTDVTVPSSTDLLDLIDTIKGWEQPAP